ncbi:MAG: ATP-dependent Clp protease adaptor ClpS [Saprospiraceae bacterium]|nr:ATP-dependent Clp protease adaptor ClpS [Saprospiraceae bacterium]
MGNNTELSSSELAELLQAEVTTTTTNSKLVVFNDDFNTFDWVIQCFMQVCNHTYEQAEQLSLIVHFKGKATVKTAAFDVLKPMKDSLVERGLSAVIESLVEE